VCATVKRPYVQMLPGGVERLLASQLLVLKAVAVCISSIESKWWAQREGFISLGSDAVHCKRSYSYSTSKDMSYP
jgi:hypothetical protein